MLNSKENKKLNRAALKTITGGAIARDCQNICTHIGSHGQQMFGCPDGQECVSFPCAANPRFFEQSCQ